MGAAGRGNQGSKDEEIEKEREKGLTSMMVCEDKADGEGQRKGEVICSRANEPIEEARVCEAGEPHAARLPSRCKEVGNKGEELRRVCCRSRVAA